MKLISILTDPLKGGTFLTWTLHFLAGHTSYYSAVDDTWLPVPENPLTQTNAHAFFPNHPGYLDAFNLVLDRILACPTETFHSIYIHNFTEYPYCGKFAETKQALDRLLPVSAKNIVLTNQPSNLLYDKSLNLRYVPGSFKQPLPSCADQNEFFNDFIDYFFADSKSKWNTEQLDSIWDQREFLALNYKHEAVSISPLLDLSLPHYSIDCMEWFNTADYFIDDLVSYLDLPRDQQKIDQWLGVYEIWKKMHSQRLNFLWNFDKIINYIVTGNFMDLKRLNLDLYQEAIIQHELIYQHNLNLKTHQLEKFNDTLQLHNLLEPNIHNLSNKEIQHSV